MNDDRVVGKPMWNLFDVETTFDQQFEAVMGLLQVNDSALREGLYHQFLVMNEYFDCPEYWDYE